MYFRNFKIGKMDKCNKFRALIIRNNTNEVEINRIVYIAIELHILALFTSTMTELRVCYRSHQFDHPAHWAIASQPYVRPIPA